MEKEPCTLLRGITNCRYYTLKDGILLKGKVIPISNTRYPRL